MTVKKKDERDIYEKTFKETGISDKLISALKNQGITEPTEVQQNAIPDILSGKT